MLDTPWTWSYRMVEDLTIGFSSFKLMEVYYDEEGVIQDWLEATAPHGGTVQEFMEDAHMQHSSLAEPPLQLISSNDGRMKMIPHPTYAGRVSMHISGQPAEPTIKQRS